MSHVVGISPPVPFDMQFSLLYHNELGDGQIQLTRYLDRFRPSNLLSFLPSPSAL